LCCFRYARCNQSAKYAHCALDDRISRSLKQAVVTRLHTTMANRTLFKILFPSLKTKATRTGASKGVISRYHSRTTTASLQWCGSQWAQFALHPRPVLAKCGVHISATADLRGEGETRHRIFPGHTSAHVSCYFNHPLSVPKVSAIEFEDGKVINLYDWRPRASIGSDTLLLRARSGRVCQSGLSS
jgi:hypothetical protein